MTGRRLAVAVAAAALVASASGARADDAGVFTFTVSRNGEPIGEHREAFRHDGTRIEIDAATELRVTFAMIPVFRFSHQRREIWQDGRPLLIAARTNSDGDKLDITLRPNGHGYIRTVNDRVDRLDPSTRVLAFWNRDTVTAEPGRFVSVVEDDTLEVAFSYLGRETLTIAGRQLEADHYRMVGDEERDIWYDPDGQVARVTFPRGGAEIEYLRNEYHSAPLTAANLPQ
jgi:Family of unknown function (DUF6134)